ncbi:nucleotidyl transferase AbiEii/AbiGii toxin family protein [[Flexibacter] sp. ATCC 35208]|uniref:nucleotidyl transferase AbiEii/AbiGii toxin family protein n=1 Tax=[Flexibacter] sp. ATCC 35208 TaxID=1936242 RepID=UPI0009C5468C|nr:nucleotidyl transferase AbiEii/AbiGii toxin family protein [[Flexibacter] sp. ATCC 35208]OMP81209.1 hypothetical protein BW716_01110 [[Flexibacter] sp. ATCC 35208]
MPAKIYWNTVTPLLKEVLLRLMNCEVFEQFRLVGGTALSLQMGHRLSVDIDLFTDADYGSIDFQEMDKFLLSEFAYVSDSRTGPIAFGKSYFIGESEADAIKLDIYYTDKFIQPVIKFGNISMATIEEIIAMKLEVVQHGARKKDFWDLHELINDYTPEQMLDLHLQRYPYGHDEKIIRSNLIDFSQADADFEPICLKGKHWEIVKLEMIEFMEARKS